MNEKLEEFYRSIAGRNVTVIGIGVSNAPLIRLLVQKGAIVTACDKRTAEQLGPVAKELLELGVTLHLGENYLEGLSGELIFKTPGMRFDNPALEQARARGCRVTSEMEVFFELCPCKLIAVTGSDGKSTTTTLVAKLLEAQGYTVHLGGNLGRPLLPDIESISPQDMAVLELSSFQLHTMRKSPDIAVITNLSPNHLDWHTSMEEYVDAKRNIYRFQSPQDLLVLNADNEITAAMVPQARGRVRTFGKGKDNFLFTDQAHNILHEGEILLRRSEVLLPGDHNIENYMAAICAVWDLVSRESIRRVAGSFAGLEHRLELVRTRNGVRYYNDSIASSPTRTMACLNSFDQKLILLLGGYDKHTDFMPLCREIIASGRIDDVVVMGETARQIREQLEEAGYDRITQAYSLRDAVDKARALAVSGGNVLLSPACASFDMFRDYEHRGQAFKELVAALG